MTVTYQVGGGGHLDIDFWVSTLSFILKPGDETNVYIHKLADPENKALSKQIKQSTGTASITAGMDGRHEYCFSNMMSAISDKIVRFVAFSFLSSPTAHNGNSFNVHGVIYIGADCKLMQMPPFHTPARSH
jgi:p24 family protein beta-1